MSTIAEGQAANVTPPMRGAILALAVDGTARAYDLQSLLLGGYRPGEANVRKEFVFLTLQAEAGDVYFHFSETDDDDLDEGTETTAGSALAFHADHAWRLKADTEKDVRINRATARFLVVKTASGTATLRLYASSEGF